MMAAACTRARAQKRALDLRAAYGARQQTRSAETK